MVTLYDLLKAVPEGTDLSKIQIVFGDDNTEYTYGTMVTNVGPDHVGLTWDVDQCFYSPQPDKFLSEME